MTPPRQRPRASELALVIVFVAMIAAVPITQTWLELARGQRVQFTDVFRQRPTADHLRQFEQTLAEKSWFQQRLRPQLQRLLFSSLRDTGAKAVLGREQWLFYRPDLRYLIEPDRPETDTADARWARREDGLTRRESALRAIVRFRDQLQERGIALVVMPVPGKPAIYPDRITRRVVPAESRRSPTADGTPGAARISPTLDLLDALRRQGVPVVDLFEVFDGARTAAGGGPLYLARDTHWTPRGALLASQAAADTLKILGLAPAATRQFQTRAVPVTRWGDILDLMQIPGLREDFPPESALCEQVLDPALGPLVPSASDRPGTCRYPGQKASVLVLGDSFCRIYQYAEPPSLGETNATEKREESRVKRLLPGSAGFVSHLALALGAPVDAIVSDGGAATDVRRKLSTNPEILEGKRVVLWAFVERDLALGREGWEDVPLPVKLD